MELTAFRGSAKSTLASLALPLWASIFKKKNFVILCSDTFAQSKQNISNLIFELRSNERIKEDFGDFQTKKEEWSATNIVLRNNVRIIAKSKGQQMRGLRHIEHRPDLAVCDDIESIDDVRTKERRDKTEEWFLSDLMPAMDNEKGKVVLVGNLLHTDSLMARMKAKKLGVVKEYPLLDSKGKSRWPEKFTDAKVAEIKKMVGQRYFMREYLLKLIPEEGAVVEKVHYYQKLPRITQLAIGTDLAISQKQTADYTTFNVAGQGEDGNIYNLYNFYGRLLFNQTLSKLNEVYKAFKEQYPTVPIKVGWEDVAYQRAGAEEATRRYSIPIDLVRRTTDKRARLQVIEPHLSSGHVKFRENGDEDVVIQILNFGVEAHDDLADAFEMSITMLINKVRKEIIWL